jgi:hypothetical protein
MDTALLSRLSDFEWRIEAHGKCASLRSFTPSEELIRDMDNKVYEPIVNVATLPGIRRPPMRCPMLTGDTDFLSAGSRPLIRRRAERCRPAESGSTFLAVCARC